jgi:hypothetical protein
MNVQTEKIAKNPPFCLGDKNPGLDLYATNQSLRLQPGDTILRSGVDISLGFGDFCHRKHFFGSGPELGVFRIINQFVAADGEKHRSFAKKSGACDASRILMS